MTQLKKHAFVFLLASLLFNSKAQDNKSSFSLQEAIDYAMKNSPSILNADNDLLAAKYKKREIAGIGYPQINASFDIKDFFKIPVQVIPNFVSPAVMVGLVTASAVPAPDPILLTPEGYDPLAAAFGTKYQAGASISISQIIFSSDYIVALQAAKYLELMGTINSRRSKADLVASVSKAYYTVLVNKERISLFDANLERLKKLLNDTKLSNVQGFVELIDVERLEVTLNNLTIEKQRTERLMALGDAALRFQMGYVNTNELILTDALPESLDEQEISLNKIDPSNRPEYQLLKSSYELNELNLRRQKLGYLPTVAAYANGGYNAFRSEFNFFQSGEGKDWYPTLLVGGTINLNIFDGFQRHNRIQQAKLEINKSKQNLVQIQQVVDLETKSAIANLNNAISSLKIQTKNKQLAAHVQDVASKKYQEGVGNNIEVITAETSLREAQTNYYNAIYEMLIAKIDYQKATGTLVK